MSSEVLRPIFEALNAKSQVEAAAILGLRQSTLSDCIHKGYVTDNVYVALARTGIDIRDMISKERPDIINTLSAILNVEYNETAIAKALSLPTETIQRCIDTGQINPPVYIALARKGYDIRKFWMKNSEDN